MLEGIDLDKGHGQLVAVMEMFGCLDKKILHLLCDMGMLGLVG